MAALLPSARQIYRELFRYARQSKDMQGNLSQLRSEFRKPLALNEELKDRLQHAESRLSFIRMTTVKNNSTGKTGKWIYRNGEKLEAVNGTLRDSSGRVVSNWSGNNLDPESVTTHRKQLRRMGFKGNAHAKGFF